jgi:hypothetical protein
MKGKLLACILLGIGLLAVACRGDAPVPTTIQPDPTAVIVVETVILPEPLPIPARLLRPDRLFSTWSGPALGAVKATLGHLFDGRMTIDASGLPAQRHVRLRHSTRPAQQHHLLPDRDRRQ